MKILYFSGTGNSYVTASLIAGREGELYNMGTTDEKVIADEYVGIVVPCYCGDIPLKAQEVLKRIRIVSDYIFAVVTCGGGAGNSFYTINNCIKENGAKLSYTAALVLPDNSIVFSTKTEKAKKQLSTHKARVEKINRDISSKVVSDNIRDKKTPSAYTRLVWRFFKRFYKLDDKKTNPRCILCGRCVKICPVNNIKMENGKIIFGSRCENCFACIHRCDKMAIEFGKIRVTRATRYYHPGLPEVK